MAIISHKHEFIFIHCRKTAGTSIEKSLIRYLGREDVINTGSGLEPIDHTFFGTRNMTTRFNRIESYIKGWVEELASKGFISCPEWILLNGSHVPARQFRDQFEDVWENYLKFCVIRNTYDRVVSQWRFMVNKSGNDIGDISLNDFLEVSKRMMKEGYSSWYTYTIDDEPVMDEYVRFDNLKKDLEKVLREKVGMYFDGWIPKENSGTRVRDEYGVTKSDIEKIYKVHQKEIDYWGFEVPDSL